MWGSLIVYFCNPLCLEFREGILPLHQHVIMYVLRAGSTTKQLGFSIADQT
jgi:hypothetical protein